MEALTACTVVGRFPIRFPSTSRKSRSLSHRRPPKFRALASREGPELDKWDQMELKFGRLIGEDPKLTLAKIMARKENPDVSYLDVEKSFMKNKRKLDESMLNIPINVNVERKPFNLPREKKLNLNLSRPVMKKGDRTTAGLNLSRPVMNKGVNATNPELSYLDVEKSFRKNKDKLDESMLNIPINVNVERQPSDLPREKKLNLNLSRPVMKKGDRTTAELNLSRPVMNKGVNATRPVDRPARIEAQKSQLRQDIANKSLTPNFALRKPDVVQEDDIEIDKHSKLRIKPNMVLKMRKDNDENISDVTLLKKPEVVQKPLDPDQENMSASGPVQSSSGEAKAIKDAVKPLSVNEMLQDKPAMTNAIEPSDSISDSIAKSAKLDGLDTGLQPPEQSVVESHDVEDLSAFLDEKSVDYSNDVSQQASLLGKPQRSDSSAKEVLPPTGKLTASLNESHSSDSDMKSPVSAEQEEREGNDWKRAEHLLHTGERTEVELISCSGRGFVVSFGSIVGFLPYRNLGAKWKFLAFESWLKEKGLDPSLYRKNLSFIGSYDIPNPNLVMESDRSQEMGEKNEDTLTPGMQFEDLLEAYDKDKTKFLSSFVGQRIKVSVLLADRNSRRLMFSGRPKENGELVEKKRSLMAKLNVGDVVKCCIKKIAYFGIFVEVEGVPALIHQSEVSWDATLDPSSYYKIDQIVEAKVHNLDYALERINLSLKEIMPDPLMEALESVVGDHTSLGGSLEAAEADIEPWADVDSLIEELQQIDGVQSVSKGRFFLSPGLAPTFQVYMASIFDNQYKLLARYGNKAQEVKVQASLDKEQMKAVILTCTNRVQ